ncbi:O-phosphoseryl-tRNA(Sec) selenium transferase [Methanocaldococcus villosus KIN24-T80]|uniref:O-phosphoseryl-tRNA(Sec) selenium transferase n=1 Tax=Methanocaldococcus villosus KIN24-T80 TaxID=1069083 RepID=N6VS65_9EURY|nr:O-phosphoseryl-tRNA(Sec) selenium transferase [Methanocaldococcus villosus]ENN96720.1 O-phosphoseryl-tRNA(Sec) selenium transferase [Methanocaldococcus villosus KIN24-T80]
MLNLNFTGLIPENMEKRGKLTLKDNLNIIEEIFNQRKIPKEGLDDDKIKLLLKILSLMDTDKDPKVIQIGEREARIASRIQNELVAGFCHGIGRSGNLIDAQPKAPGASIMYALTNKILENFLKNLGLKVNAIATPVATGMSLALCLSAARKRYYSNVVIYPYASHKSPIKATSFIGMRMRLVETKLYEDAVRVDVSDIENAIKKEIKENNNPCVLSTLTFFPPRESDDVIEISKICEEFNIPHIINGAYAIQNKFYIDKLNKAFKYRVDAVVSSSDKNLFTPIGGGIIYSRDKEFLRETSLCYPGRACATPVVNILISFLSLGMNKYLDLMKKQKECKKLLDNLLNELAEKKGEKVLNVKNPISSAITTKKDPVEVAAKLYNLRITGPRGVRKNDKFGTCYLGEYPYDYIVVNSAIGVKEEDIYKVVEKLERVI